MNFPEVDVRIPRDSARSNLCAVGVLRAGEAPLEKVQPGPRVGRRAGAAQVGRPADPRRLAGLLWTGAPGP